MTSTTSSAKCVKQGVTAILQTIKSSKAIIIIYLSILTFFGLINITLELGLSSFDGAFYGFRIPINMMFSETTLTALVIGFALAVKSFSYLHSKRQTDLFGEMPISRRTLFFSKSIAVILIAGIPMLAVLLFLNIGGDNSTISGTIFGYNSVWNTLRACVMLIANVALFGLLSVCCGRNSDKIIIFITINLASPFLITLTMAMPAAMLWGCPLDSAFINQCSTVLSPALAFNDTAGYHIYWLCFALVCFALSFVLIKRRKAECAQSGFAFRLPLIATKIIVSLSFGLILGYLFAATGMNGKNDYLNFWIGMLLGSAVSFTIIQIVLAHGLKGFVKGLIPYAAALACFAVFFICLATGWFGYDTYVPKPEDVKSISFTDNISMEVDGKNIVKHECSDKNVIKMALDSHKKDVADMLEFQNVSMTELLMSKFAHSMPMYEYMTSQFNVAPESYYVTYTLNNGQKVSRIFINSENEEGKSVKLYPSFTKTDEFAENYYPLFICDEKYAFEADFYNTDYDDETDSNTITDSSTLGAKRAQQLVRALKKDYKTKPYENISETEVQIRYGKDGEYYVEMYIPVPKTYTETLKVLGVKS